MKKIIMIVITAILFTLGLSFTLNDEVQISNALASSETLYTSDNYFSTENLDVNLGYFAINESGNLEGIKNLKEATTYLPLNVSNKAILHGFYDDGTVTRVKGLAKIKFIENVLVGLVPMSVEIIIDPAYEELVNAIVKERVGEINTANIIGATLWSKNNYIGHIFYTSTSFKIEVGYIKFEQENVYLKLYVGDINNDGHYELGFLVHKK